MWLVVGSGRKHASVPLDPVPVEVKHLIQALAASSFELNMNYQGKESGACEEKNKKFALQLTAGCMSHAEGIALPDNHLCCG